MLGDFWRDLRTKRLLKRLGQAQYRDLHISDGMGGDRVIERLVLTGEGISLVQVIRYEGRIFCAEDIDEWTQMLDGGSFRFANPMIELGHSIQAVQAKVKDVPVDGYLFFDHRASFPRGCPDRVIQFDSVPEALRRVKDASIPKYWLQQWESLRP